MRPYIPVPASLFSPPWEGPGEAFHAENVGTHGSCVHSNTLIKPSIFHSCCIERSGRTSRASLHAGARKLVLPSFERSGGGFPCGECGDAWPIRPLKYGASKYINKRISKQVVGGAHSPHAPMPVTSAILRANLSHFAVQSHPF